MNEVVLLNLNRVLVLQLAAVQQHFIHVLMLRAWNEDALADRIASIDAIDLPNAMRIVDCVASTGHLPTLANDHRTLAGIMPGPGDSPSAIQTAELQLDCRLKQVLTSVERELTPFGKNVPIDLVSTPLEIRTAYQDWLRQQLEHPCSGTRSDHPTDTTGLNLDSLFANLMVMINQTLVHAFVHWHRGERNLADSVWEMCGASMMHAADIVNALAPRHAAPDPARAAIRGEVALPRLAAVPQDALTSDRLLAERCRAAARRAAVARRETDPSATCSRIETYYGEVVRWRPGQMLPRLDNPCADFERILREYVWSDSIDSTPGQ